MAVFDGKQLSLNGNLVTAGVPGIDGSLTFNGFEGPAIYDFDFTGDEIRFRLRDDGTGQSIGIPASTPIVIGDVGASLPGIIGATLVSDIPEALNVGFFENQVFFDIGFLVRSPGDENIIDVDFADATIDARDDLFVVAPTETISGNFFADNGFGADTHSEGDALELGNVDFSLFSANIFINGVTGDFTFSPTSQDANLPIGQFRVTSVSLRVNDQNSGLVPADFSTATFIIANLAPSATGFDGHLLSLNGTPLVGGAAGTDARLTGEPFDFDFAGDQISFGYRGASSAVGFGFPVPVTITDLDGELPAIRNVAVETGTVPQGLAASENGVTFDLGTSIGIVTEWELGATTILDVDFEGASVTATDNTAGFSEGGSAIGGNVLTDGTADSHSEDDPLVVSGFAIGGVTGTLGTAIDLEAGGRFTLNANGSWSFNDPDGDFERLGGGATLAISIAYTARDSNFAAGPSDSATLTLTILGGNDAPVLAGTIGPQQVTEDAAFTLPLPARLFTDIDAGDTLTYSATLLDGSALPAWLQIDPATGALSGTPGNVDVGDRAIRITARDAGGLTAVATFTLSVLNSNDPPVAVDLAVSTTEDAPVSGQVSALDPDLGDTLAFALAGPILPGAALAANGRFTFDPGSRFQSLDAGASALVTFDFTASDAAGASDTGTVSITVRGVEDLPILLTPIVDREVTRNATITPFSVAASFADVDGDAFAFSATGLPAGLTLAANGLISGRPTVMGLYDVTITANSGPGQFVRDTFQLGVTAGPGNNELEGTARSDQLLGGAGNDELEGKGGDDLLLGGSGNDELEGGQGNDRLLGGTGNDVLKGDSGDDVLTAGAGFDLVVTGSGRDRVVFGPGAGFDGILDFTQGHDVVDLEAFGLSTAQFATILNNATNTLVGAVLTFSGGEQLQLVGYGKAALTLNQASIFDLA